MVVTVFGKRVSSHEIHLREGGRSFFCSGDQLYVAYVSGIDLTCFGYITTSVLFVKRFTVCMTKVDQ